MWDNAKDCSGVAAVAVIDWKSVCSGLYAMSVCRPAATLCFGKTLEELQERNVGQ